VRSRTFPNVEFVPFVIAFSTAAISFINLWNCSKNSNKSLSEVNFILSKNAHANFLLCFLTRSSAFWTFPFPFRYHEWLSHWRVPLPSKGHGLSWPCNEIRCEKFIFYLSVWRNSTFQVHGSHLSGSSNIDISFGFNLSMFLTNWILIKFLDTM